MEPPKRQIAIIAGAASLVFIADQITKELIIRNIEAPAPYRGDVFFHFTHQRNTGLMGGAFSDITWVAFVAPIVAIFVFIYMYRQLDPAARVQAIAYGCVLGGALGNLIDRFRHGAVTDFLQFHFLFIPFDFPWKYYPAFNIADAGIMCGIVVLFFTLSLAPEPDVSRDS